MMAIKTATRNTTRTRRTRRTKTTTTLDVWLVAYVTRDGSTEHFTQPDGETAAYAAGLMRRAGVDARVMRGAVSVETCEVVE